jgi:hypothetical protein
MDSFQALPSAVLLVTFIKFARDGILENLIGAMGYNPYMAKRRI